MDLYHLHTGDPLLEPGTERPVSLDDNFRLTFNQAMDAASVENNFNLVGPAGPPVVGNLTWNETSTQVTFTPDTQLERDTAYSIVLSGAALSQGGAPLGQDFAATFSTVPQFGVIRTSPEAGETLEATYGYGSVVITLSAPIAPGQDLDSLVTLSPAVSGGTVNRSMDGDQVYVSGYFQPSASYTLIVSTA